MDSGASTTTLPLSSPNLDLQNQTDHGGCSFRQKQTGGVPTQFIWPKADLVHAAHEELLMEPVVDLAGFFGGGDNAAAAQQAAAAAIIRAAGLKHGFFQVINHGVDPRLISDAYDHMDNFFNQPTSHKLKARRMPGNMWGYSGAHAHRFSSKLPWKETLSFGFHDRSLESTVVDFFTSSLGKDYHQTGLVYQKYCEEMKRVSLAIMELLGMSLGVDKLHYKNYFEDGCSIMRCNYYPPCEEPGLAFGTGPHCDPTALTILHQDEVGGLQVYSDDRWLAVRPRRDALVVNIGETFMALSNGEYKSCLHRAIVNRYKERRSLAYFVCPREDKLVRPPPELLEGGGGGGTRSRRLYPDFTWSDLLHFTQNHYRADHATLHNFTNWLLSSKSSL